MRKNTNQETTVWPWPRTLSPRIKNAGCYPLSDQEIDRGDFLHDEMRDAKMERSLHEKLEKEKKEMEAIKQHPPKA